MTTFRQYQEVVQILTHAKRPLIVLLKDVDPDALGSSMALARALQQQGVKPILFCLSELPESLDFLLDASLPVVHDVSIIAPGEIDCVVSTDTGQLQRTGVAAEVKELVKNGVSLINIDHHRVHEPFGTVNLVDPRASAACVLVYDVLKLGGWNIDKPIATALLAGIVADTDNFSNAGTTIRSLEVAAHCYNKGAEVRRVLNELYKRKPIDALKLWGKVLTRLNKNNRWGIVSTVILQSDFRSYDITDEATEGLANFLNGIADMKAAMILKEQPGGEIRGSLRTTRDDIDVAKLASTMGGGGHRKAAGFTVQGKLIETDSGWHIEPYTKN